MKTRKSVVVLGLLISLLFTTGAVSASDDLRAYHDPAGIAFEADVSFRSLSLRVVGEDQVVQRTFASAAEAYFSPGEFGLPDGEYNYELVLNPDDNNLSERAVTRNDNQRLTTRQAHKVSGFFRIVNGSIWVDTSEEPPTVIGATQAQSSGLVGTTLADQVILDDLIVEGSACIGLDCSNGESFGFDTLRLKENNLRIKFQDTSASASFPSNDWQITANDSTNGGANKFSIDDIDGGRTPFTIEASAPSHSLYVDDGGRVGLGTSTPVVELHVVNGDSPTLRLEQNGSSGFTPQTWDVAGNETNWFVRDATNGSRLPMKIRPSAPTNSLFIDTDGDIGLGTASPSAALDIASGNVEVTSIPASGTAAASDVLTLTNHGPSRLLLQNTNAPTTDAWILNHDNNGDLRFANPAAGVTEFLLDRAGNLTITGQLITTGPQCAAGTPCDGVFAPDFEVESIEEHAAFMWENKFLPSVGPTVGSAPINLSERTGLVLNELEKAHIYIEQLNNELKSKSSELELLRERMAAMEAVMGLGDGK